jgi:hypothetical protein
MMKVFKVIDITDLAKASIIKEILQAIKGPKDGEGGWWCFGAGCWIAIVAFVAPFFQSKNTCRTSRRGRIGRRLDSLDSKLMRYPNSLPVPGTPAVSRSSSY